MAMTGRLRVSLFAAVLFATMALVYCGGKDCTCVCNCQREGRSFTTNPGGCTLAACETKCSQEGQGAARAASCVTGLSNAPDRAP